MKMCKVWGRLTHVKGSSRGVKKGQNFQMQISGISSGPRSNLTKYYRKRSEETYRLKKESERSEPPFGSYDPLTLTLYISAYRPAGRGRLEPRPPLDET